MAKANIAALCFISFVSWQCLIMDEKLRENDEYLKNLHKLEPKNELPHLPDACKFYAKGILSLLKQFIVRILTIVG